MLVPSLSWQNDRFLSVKLAQKKGIFRAPVDIVVELHEEVQILSDLLSASASTPAAAANANAATSLAIALAAEEVGVAACEHRPNDGATVDHRPFRSKRHAGRHHHDCSPDFRKQRPKLEHLPDVHTCEKRTISFPE